MKFLTFFICKNHSYRRESRYPCDPEASGPKGEQDKGESGTSCELKRACVLLKK
jgi:hypothetical protein